MTGATMLTAVVLLLLGADVCRGEVFVEKTWDGGMHAYVRFNIEKGILGGWTITLRFNKETTSLNIYAADIVDTRLGGREYLLKNEHYNNNLKEGDLLNLKFTAAFSGEAPQGEAWLHEQRPPPDFTTLPPTTASYAPKPPPGRVLWKHTNWNHKNILEGWKASSIHWGKENMKVTADPSDSRKNALRVLYKKDSYVREPVNKGGCQFRAHPFTKSSALTLTYDIYFSKNFDFVKGGKLAGFYGGQTGCSGGRKADCFSARFMWRRDGAGELYMYIPHEKQNWFCKLKNVHCNFQYGHSFGRGTFYFKKGQWNKIQQYIRLNDPGKANGVLKMWHDGKLAFEISGLTLRTSKSLLVDSIYFSTFFGGSTADWRSSADVYTYYRNFFVTDREPY